MNHLDQEVDRAITKLCEKLIQWERATGRQSILILRENNGEMPGESMAQSGFVVRAMNGIPLGSANDDLSDDYLLRPFRVQRK